MNKFKNTLIPVFVMILLVLVSGCLRKETGIINNNISPIIDDVQTGTTSDSVENISTTTKLKGEVKYAENGEVDISNWLTYLNEDYGFEIKVPEFWVNSQTPELKRINFYNDGIKRDGSEPQFGPNVALLIQKLDNNSVIEREKSKGQNVLINGNSAIKFERIPGGQEPETILSYSDKYYIENNDNIYMIVFYTHWFEGDDFRLVPIIDKKVYDVILNSFTIL